MRASVVVREVPLFLRYSTSHDALDTSRAALTSISTGYSFQTNELQTSTSTARRWLHASHSCFGAIGLDSPEFKRNMRMLLMKVHPDRFQSHPEAQKANEESLKTLQTYMQELRGLGGQPGYPYHFEFHMWGNDDSGVTNMLDQPAPTSPALEAFRRDPRNWVPEADIESKVGSGTKGDNLGALGRGGAESRAAGLQGGSTPDTAAAAKGHSDEGQLRKVSLRLPAPGPGAGERLPRGVRTALGRLFAACGLNNIFQGDDDLVSGIDSDQLRFFLPDAVELARQGESVLNSLPAQQVQSMLTGFSYARKVRVVFDEEVKRLHPGKHVRLLEALARAFDKAASAKVSSCTVVIGEGSGVDGLGRLWLRHDESTDAWCRTLQTADMSVVQSRRAHAERAREAEEAVAALVGLDSIFTGQRFALSAAYMEFLQRVGITAESIGPIYNGRLRGVHLCVLPVPELSEMDHVLATGVVKVNSDAHVLDMWDYISCHGPHIMHLRQREAAKEKELKELAREVERQLMLRRLSRDASLSHDDFKSGCYRLLRHRNDLVHHVEGTVIRLSHQNGIKPGDTVVDIAWNFVL